MAYTRHTWNNGELITADKLNNIESGVEELDSNILTLEEIQASTDLSGKIASASALQEVNRRLVSATLSYDNGYFLLGDNPVPYNSNQYAVLGRNIQSGSIYALWYDQSLMGFTVAHTITGSAPSSGNSISIQYFS